MEPTNYCKDEASWAEWNALVAKKPGDDNVQTLHALRIGLCVKVEQGSISVERATILFERARTIIIEQIKKEAEQDTRNKG